MNQTATIPTWRRFIGLPHALAADPHQGEAADCLLVAFSVLAEAGRPHPEPNPHWFELARASRWSELQTIWSDLTEPLSGPEPYAVTLIKNGPAGLGVGVVVDDGLLITHHRRGVSWVPLSALKPLSFARFK
jgi:hypothetical protein